MPLALLALTIGALQLARPNLLLWAWFPPLLTTCYLAAFCGTAGLYLRAGRGDRRAGADGADRAYAA
jgi:hypothetical protein